LYSSIIHAPTFFLERQLSSIQIEEHLKSIDAQIEAYKQERRARKPSFVHSMISGKIQSAPKKIETSSVLSRMFYGVLLLF